MDKSAIVLARSTSNRFNEDIGLLKVNNKPLLSHVIDSVKTTADEVIVVTSSKERANLYVKIVSPDVKFAVNSYEAKGTLIDALTGFETAQGEYSLLLPFDTPFISREVVSFLFELCIGKSAVVPRWPNNQIEPLHAVYYTKKTLETAKKALANDELEIETVLNKMKGVRYISTLVIEQLDPDLRTFFKITTPIDLKKAEAMIKHRKH